MGAKWEKGGVQSHAMPPFFRSGAENYHNHSLFAEACQSSRDATFSGIQGLIGAFVVIFTPKIEFGVSLAARNFTGTVALPP